MLQLDVGEASLDGVGFLRHCLRCGQNGAVRLEVAGSTYTCAACGAANRGGGAEDVVVATGPTWIGALHDGAFLDSMRAVAEGLHAPGDDWGKAMRVMDGLRDEAELPPLYYALGAVGKSIGGSVPSVERIGRRLEESGFRMVKAHARPRCVKTDAPYCVLVEAARRAARDAVEGVGGGAPEGHGDEVLFRS